MKRIATIATVCLSLGSGLSYADTLGFSVGGYFWQQDYDGSVLSSDLPGDEIDLQRDLGLIDDSGSTLYLVLEHPVPLLPNLMLQRTALEIEETSEIARSFEFDGISYTVGDDVLTNSDLSHTDATLYYQVLDNWVSVDFGLTVRHFDEGVRLDSAISGASELELDATIPMLYFAAEGELPFSGFFARAEANGVSYSDSKLLDYKVSLGYESDFGIGVELGLRNFDVDYEDDNEQANVTIDGGYAGIYYHF